MAGKGGVGKTTVSALVTRYFSEHKNDPLLAIDADPNSNLGEVVKVLNCPIEHIKANIL